MMQNDNRRLLFDALADPAFYPHRVTAIRRVETHISTVILTGPFVYKIKKPVDFGFVDFSDLAKRRYYCEQEVRLNRRLTNGIYLAVVAFALHGKRVQMDGPGEVVEYAVRMRQLSAADTLERLIAHGALSDTHLKQLAAVLAEFHENADQVKDKVVWALVKSACDENCRHIRAHGKDVLNNTRLDEIASATGTVLNRHRNLFRRRTEKGKVRYGHGDLRCEHVYFTAGGEVQILDCIEFNDDLRTVDVASDLAFLVMDFDYLGSPQSASTFLDAYCRASGDASLLSLMAFYQCYRAMVRCKVSCIQLSNAGHGQDELDTYADSARRYLNLALAYARRMIEPTLWVFCGLPASGKSTLSSELAAVVDAECFNSDRIRKQLFGLAPRDRASGPLDRGVYSADASRDVYSRLHALARTKLKAGASVILDATYGASANRDAARALAKACAARIYFAECVAATPIIQRRLKQREHSASVSDARLDHFEALRSRFTPLDDVPPARHIRIDTAAPPQSCIQTLLIERYVHRMEPIDQ